MANRKKWEHFERLVAAVHRAADEGADVRWNEKINGRQFDVVVRYTKGLYNFLIVVECKDYKTPVPVSDVEAFVTKSRSAKANRAIIASSCGFQSGAAKVAREHDIVLLHFQERDRDYAKYGQIFNGKIEVRHITEIALHFQDGKVFYLSTFSNEVEYCFARSRFFWSSDFFH